MNPNDDLMREYTPGDESDIVKLHNDVFGVDRTLAHWNWKFIDHVQGRGWITLAEDGNEIVGQYCMMRNHLNFVGREVVSGQSCDTMVRSDQRGKKWFTRLAKRNYEYAVGKGLEAVFGFPSHNSFPGIMRNLEWNRIFSLKYYSYWIGFRKIWGSKLDRVFKYLHGMVVGLKYLKMRVIHKDLEIVVSSKLPDELENILNEIRENEVLSVWKDLPYLRWRYEKHPDFDYTFHVLFARGRPEGLIVTRVHGQSIAICEVLHRTKNVSQTAFLLSHVLKYFHFSDDQSIKFYGYDSGFFDAVFSRCGFSIDTSSDLVFGGRVFGDVKLEKVFIFPHNWTVAYGDTDVI